MKEFILVPAGKYASMCNGEDSNKTSNIPVQITSEISRPEYSKSYNINTIHKTGLESLEKEISPELNLKLFNHFQNMYRSAIKKTDSDTLNVEKMQSNNDISKNDVNIYIEALPASIRSMAHGLLVHLQSGDYVKIDGSGYVNIPSSPIKIHLIEFFRAILISNSKIEVSVLPFYNEILSKIPPLFVRNKHLVGERKHTISGQNTHKRTKWERY